jgi:hypothetical protein
LNNQLIMRLGDRDGRDEHTTALAYDASSAILTAVSLTGIKQWVAPIE